MSTQVREVFVNGEKRYQNSKGEYFESPFMANMSDGVFGWGTADEVERRKIDPSRGKGGRMPSIYEKRVPGLPPSAAFPVAGSGPASNQVGSDADPNTPGRQGDINSAYSYGELPASISETDKGKGPKGNEVGSDADPSTPGLQGPGAISRNAPAPDGSEAKGTQMGYQMKFDDLNSLVTRQTGSGMADINSFLSEALPVTPAGDEQGRPLQAGSVAPGEAVVEGISTPGETGTSPIETADNNRAVSVPGEMDVRALRRQAFLNPELNSMQALRAADAAIGLQAQGGKYFVNDGSEALEITKDEANKYRGGNLSAKELMGTYKEGIKETLVPATQTDITTAFDPDSAVSKAVSSISSGPMRQSPEEMGPGQDIEFHMNNAPPITYDAGRESMKKNYFKNK